MVRKDSSVINSLEPSVKSDILETKMNDPHVEELIYRLETGQSLNFSNPKPIKREANDFIWNWLMIK